LKYLTKRLQEIFPAKTPGTQRKKFTYFPKLGALCAFAGVFFPPFKDDTNFKYVWLALSVGGNADPIRQGQ
jgi:hypothetical protein